MENEFEVFLPIIVNQKENNMAGVNVSPIKAIDISKWQPNVDWSCMSNKGLIFAGMRATIANYYKDDWFKRHAEGAKSKGIIRVPYHVTRAEDKILGVSNTPMNQMDMFDAFIDGYHDGVVCLDVELAQIYNSTSFNTKQKVTDTNLECLRIARQRYDEVYWYSRATFMDDYMAVDDSFKTLDLWLAEYGLNDGLWYGCHLVPKGCTKEQIVIHQFTSKGPAFCCDPIVKVLDYNVIINVDTFNDIHEIEDEVIDPPSDCNCDEERLLEIERRLTALEANASATKSRLDNARLNI